MPRVGMSLSVVITSVQDDSARYKLNHYAVTESLQIMQFDALHYLSYFTNTFCMIINSNI